MGSGTTNSYLLLGYNYIVAGGRTYSCCVVGGRRIISGGIDRATSFIQMFVSVSLDSTSVRRLSLLGGGDERHYGVN